MKRTIIASLILASTQAYGAKPVTDALPVADACVGGLKLATGPADKGYNKLYKDLAAVCKERVKLCEVRTTGGLDNLSTMSNKKADIGFAQIDTVKDMAPGDDNVAALQVVTTLNYNYLHVLTASGGYAYTGDKKWGFLPGDKTVVQIKKFSDLRGRHVALVGSAQLLGRALIQRQLKDYGLIFIDVQTDKEAFAMTVSGQVQAMFTVSGAPHGEISQLTTNQGLTLVPFDEDLGGLYSVRKLNYKNIGVYNLKALAIQNVMLTRPFGEAKLGLVSQLRQCIVDKLGELKDGEYEPAWNEMKIDSNVDLPKFITIQPKRK